MAKVLSYRDVVKKRLQETEDTDKFTMKQVEMSCKDDEYYEKQRSTAQASRAMIDYSSRTLKLV